jgi:hypothetical protein
LWIDDLWFRALNLANLRLQRSPLPFVARRKPRASAKAPPFDEECFGDPTPCGAIWRLASGLLLLAVAAASLGAQEAGKAGIWLDVPFIKQTREGCGSASIAMLLQYWNAHGTVVSAGRDDAEAIQRQI